MHLFFESYRYFHDEQVSGMIHLVSNSDNYRSAALVMVYGTVRNVPFEVFREAVKLFATLNHQF
jgi:hypothetical protein